MSSTPPASSSGASTTAITTAAASPKSSVTMQFLGSASTTHNPEVDMPTADDMVDVGRLWTVAAAAAASPVGDETVAAAPEKEPYDLATGGALGPGAKMGNDASPFEVDMGGDDSYEDLIASGVNDFFDVFRALDDGPDEEGFPEGGLNAADQGMEVGDDEFAWLNSPDAFMPLPFADIAITDLPIADVGGLGEKVAATVVPSGEEEEDEAGMGPGLGNENMEEDVAGGPLVAVAGWPVPEDTPEAAPAAAAALAATTIWPPVALEGGDTAEGIGGFECAVTPAPAYDSSGGEGGGGGAAYMFARGPPDVAADVGAVGVGIAAAEAMAATPTATNMTMVNGAGGAGEHDGGLSQKELIRRQKVERYLAKKKRRRWSRAASYQSRQRVANDRPRHKGRFLPLVSDFVPMSELRRRQRALMAQRAAEEERQASFPTLEAPPDGSGASAQVPQVPGGGYYGQGEG